MNRARKTARLYRLRHAFAEAQGIDPIKVNMKGLQQVVNEGERKVFASIPYLRAKIRTLAHKIGITFWTHRKNRDRW